MDPTRLNEFFGHPARLASLCTQNGWADPETLRVDVVRRDGGELVCTVSFHEVVSDGDRPVRRIPCWGQYRLTLSDDGQVTDAALIAGGSGARG
mgnify:CR=1 FL=1